MRQKMRGSDSVRSLCRGGWGTWWKGWQGSDVATRGQSHTAARFHACAKISALSATLFSLCYWVPLIVSLTLTTIWKVQLFWYVIAHNCCDEYMAYLDVVPGHLPEAPGNWSADGAEGASQRRALWASHGSCMYLSGESLYTTLPSKTISAHFTMKWD